MRRIALAVALALTAAAVAAASAQAKVRPFWDRAATNLDAAGSYVVGHGPSAGRWTLWQGTVARPFLDNEVSLGLGSDARARAVALYSRCETGAPARDCTLRELRLPDGRRRTLVRAEEGRLAGDRRRGVLAYRRNADNHTPTRIRLLRPGHRPKLLARAGGFELHLAAAHVVWHEITNVEHRVRAVDFSGHVRTLAVDDTLDEDCHCTSSTSSISNARAAGRYAYWLVHHAESTTGTAPGGGGAIRTWSEIHRADLTKPHLPIMRIRYPDGSFVESFAPRGSGLLVARDGRIDEDLHPAFMPASAGG